VIFQASPISFKAAAKKPDHRLMNVSQSCHKGKSGNKVNARKQLDNEALTRKISSNLENWLLDRQ